MYKILNIFFCGLLCLNSLAFAGTSIGAFSNGKKNRINALMRIKCDGETIYTYHMQGFCTDVESIYWSVTNKLIKTDLNGNVLSETTIQGSFGDHMGDPAYYDGKIFVPMSLFSELGQRESYSAGVQVYDASDLSLIAEETYTADQNFSSAYVDRGTLYIGGGRGQTETHEGKLFMIDPKSLAIKGTVVLTGIDFVIGIQSIGRYSGKWVLGHYTDNNFNTPSVTFLNDDFSFHSRHDNITDGFYYGGDSLGRWLYSGALSKGVRKAQITRTNGTYYLKT